MIASMNSSSVPYGFPLTWRDLAELRHELIQRRAHEIWRAKGCPGDSAMEDWLQAESEIDAGPRHDSIEKRAYELWLEKGCPSKSSLQDWLQAERKVDTALEIEKNPNLCATSLYEETCDRERQTVAPQRLSR